MKAKLVNDSFENSFHENQCNESITGDSVFNIINIFKDSLKDWYVRDSNLYFTLDMKKFGLISDGEFVLTKKDQLKMISKNGNLYYPYFINSPEDIYDAVRNLYKWMNVYDERLHKSEAWKKI